MVQRGYFPTFDELLETDRFILIYDNQIVVRGNELVWEKSEIHAILSVGAELFLLEEDATTTFIAVHTLAKNIPYWIKYSKGLTPVLKIWTVNHVRRSCFQTDAV